MHRSDNEALLSQRAVVVWLTGLSGAGKTTLANRLAEHLYACKRVCRVLDGDHVRSGLNYNLGFSEQDRHENIRRIAEVARLFLDTGIITIVAVISPMQAMRERARQIVGADDFLEVYVRCPLEVCEQRDVKGLYRKARAGQVAQFTGVQAPYEPPSAPELILDTHELSIDQATRYLVNAVAAKTGSQVLSAAANIS